MAAKAAALSGFSVVVLAAGRGQRLEPLTSLTPKPLLPVLNVSPLWRWLSICQEQGFSEVAINAYWLAEKIEAAVKKAKSAFKELKLSLSHEEELLGTGGGVQKAAASFKGPVLVINGDIWTDLDLRLLVKRHLETQAFATIAVLNPNQGLNPNSTFNQNLGGPASLGSSDNQAQANQVAQASQAAQDCLAAQDSQAAQDKLVAQDNFASQDNLLAFSDNLASQESSLIAAKDEARFTAGHVLRPLAPPTVSVDAEGRVVGLRLPRDLAHKAEVARLYGLGVVVVSPKFKELLPVGPSDLIAELAKYLDEKVLAYPAPTTIWADIGTVENYWTLNRLLAKNKTILAKGAEVLGQTQGFVVLGAGAKIEPKAFARDCVLWPGAVLESGARAIKAVVNGRVPAGQEAKNVWLG
ncbi:MAG: NTP transferase domain-containing protein [Deltaproteobacteria bacterium]|jgi:NDP-sugar pyrophosphorylase family protein|nr:NTP transferase domain-containing protein [Deltaproteobacteria bacterium]